MKEYFKEQLDKALTSDTKLFLAVYEAQDVEIKAVSRGWEDTPYNAGYPFTFTGMMGSTGIPVFKKVKKEVYWKDATSDDYSALTESDKVAFKSLPLYLCEASLIPYKVFKGTRYNIEDMLYV